MGLKADIQKAFEVSVGGKSSEIEELSIGLAKAITEYISRQEFQIEEMNAPVLAPPPAGVGIASLSKTGKGSTGNPLEIINTVASSVKAEMVSSEEIS